MGKQVTLVKRFIGSKDAITEAYEKWLDTIQAQVAASEPTGVFEVKSVCMFPRLVLDAHDQIIVTYEVPEGV